MGLERLWADWRSTYVSTEAGRDDIGCVLCNLVAATDDAEALVLERTPETITVMNLYPYGSGHLMVAPIRHEAAFDDLYRRGERRDRARPRCGRCARSAPRTRPTARTSARTSGKAAGAGVPGHLHVHVLPRWTGDTNFMTAVGEVRVLPESLRTGYDKLKAAWPG